MSLRITIPLFSACLLALGFAIWAYTAGFGLLVSFLIYSFSGSTMLLTFCGVSFLLSPEEEAL